MTLSHESDLANYPRYLVQFDDGSLDIFACPDTTLEQGRPEGWGSLLKTVAREWQDDGYLRQGKIMGIWRLDANIPTDA